MDRPLEVGSRFGVDPSLWGRNWNDLSGGEGQRIMMAIGVALGTAEVLLLDGEFLPPPWFTLLPSPPLVGLDAYFFSCLVVMSVLVLGCILYGTRTYVCSGPRNHAGRGEIYLVDAS